MTKAEARRRRWVEKRKREGGCISCRRAAMPGHIRCEDHHGKHNAGSHRRGVARVAPISRGQVIVDLQAIARRLQVRIVSTNLYRREGSFALTDSLMRRVGSWASVCLDAGLLPTKRGCRGIDRRPCQRCGEVCVYYGSGQVWCPECRRTLRRRRTELVGVA